MATYQPRRPLDEPTLEYPNDLLGMQGRPPPSISAPPKRVGTAGPEVFVPPADGTVIPNVLPEGMTFEKPRLAAGEQWDNRVPPLDPRSLPQLPGHFGYPGTAPSVAPITPEGIDPGFRMRIPPSGYGKKLGELPEGMTFEPTNKFADTIDAVTKRTDKLGARAPMDVLGQAVPGVDRAMESPGSAASLAAWAQAYERVVQTGGGPRALGGLNLATRNLSNTLGIPFGLNNLLAGDVLDATKLFEAKQNVNQLSRDIHQQLGLSTSPFGSSPAPVIPILPYQLSRPTPMR